MTPLRSDRAQDGARCREPGCGVPAIRSIKYLTAGKVTLSHDYCGKHAAPLIHRAGLFDVAMNPHAGQVYNETVSRYSALSVARKEE